MNSSNPASRRRSRFVVMTRLIVSCWVLAALAACEPAPTAPRSPIMTESSTERNKAVVRRLYEQATNGDDQAMLSTLIAEDFVSSDGGRGAQGYAAGVAILRAGMPDVRFKVEDLLGEGDRVAVRWTFEGTHSGVFRGFAPTNKTLHNEGIAIYQLRNEKIVAVWLQVDRLGLLQQVGAVPAGIGAVRPR
jgi:predicted ester cyclase